MSFIDDEPRKIPKPIPFSEGSPLQPIVPEVSLILQDSTLSPKIIPNNSFSGTEFQSYNAWRWKNVNEKEKENLSARSLSQNKKQDFYPINDKFSGSDIERRKNEILYGNVEEPRRPLPPRPVPVIPKCVGASFSDASFSNELWNDKETEDKSFPSSRAFGINKNNFKNDNTEVKKSPRSCTYEEQKDMKDLYQIIADQNKQMVFLQKQIEQLLKSQESKEKQVEQLLKSQETKENKIEQLLKMQDVKENQIEQLLKAQEKHEKQIEQLLTAQEAREKQNHQLSKQIKSLHKELVSVGTMTTINVNEKSTNTSFCCSCKDQRPSEKTQSSEECSRFDTGDKSFTLHSLDLPAIQENIPTPQSSIHVDIPEYNASSDEESDISPSTSREVQIHNLLDSKPLGYTFYNNVLTQVNDIIHNNEDKESEEAVNIKINRANMELGMEREYQRKYLGENRIKMPNSLGRDNVEKYWGIDMYEPQTDFQYGTKSSNSNFHNNGTNPAFQLSCNNEMTKETTSPSDISLRMNALALKYLKEEQISQYQMQFQSQPTTKQPDVTIYNVTNLSFGTMRYLERYRISSHEVSQPNEGFHSRHQFLQQKAKAAMRHCNYKNM